MTNAVLKPIPMNWDYPFTLPPTVHKGSPFSTSSLTPVVSCLFVIVMLPGVNWYLVVWFAEQEFDPISPIWRPLCEPLYYAASLCHLSTCCVVSVVSNSLQPHGPWSPPGSSVHMFLQAWRLAWVAMCSSKGSFPPRDPPVSLASPALADRFYTTSTTWEISLSNSLIQKMRQEK